MLLLLSVALAKPALLYAKIHHTDETAEKQKKHNIQDPKEYQALWAFCPSYPSSYCSNPQWVEIIVDLDVYIQRRNNNHDSVFEILSTSQEDLKPLSQAFMTYFREYNIKNEAEKLGYIHGAIQSIKYAYDNCEGDEDDCNDRFSTGWTEYPKFAVEMLIEQVGDCDDAAIAVASLIQNLGHQAYIVNWPGHLSSAVSRDNTEIQSVLAPSGSRMVIDPDTGIEFLHVDAVGSLEGCKKNCKELGWNEWPFSDPPMSEIGVVSILDPSIDSKISIIARNRQGDRPERVNTDRRGINRTEVLEELTQQENNWDEENIDRLEDLGQNKEQAEKVVSRLRRESSDWFLYLIFGIIVFSFGLLLLLHYKRQNERIQKAIEKKKKQDADNYF